MRSIKYFLDELVSFVPKLRNKIYYKIQSFSKNEEKITKSDSEQLSYVSSLNKIISSQREFSRFRRIHNYREILEHVSRNQGEKYLKEIEKYYPNQLNEINKFKRNDIIGKPRTFDYESVGEISPTTLRYVKTGAEIAQIFDLDENANLIEIGAGYGGQALILHLMTGIKRFRLVDIPEAEKLIQMYLKAALGEMKNITYGISKDIEEYDLVISNYAFSELPKDLQKFYLEKVFKQSRCGYLIMNSGRTNFTRRSDAKMTLDELCTAFPNGRIFAETPTTGPDNYLFVWGAINTKNLKPLVN